MDIIKTWPHLAIIGLVCLVLGAGAVVLWVKHEQTAQASALPSPARIDRVNGEVGLNRSLDSNSTNTQWVDAEQNTPVSVGDRIYTKGNSDASVSFTGRNFARLNEDTSLDVLALADEKTQVALRDGSAVFDIGNLSSGDLFEVATPCGAVDLTERGLYQVEINDDGNATATALSGVAQIVGQGGTGRIEKGEVLTVPCAGSSAATLSRVEPQAAGTLVDHYYRYRYPRNYDGRYVNYYSYQDDPFYYDPYRTYPSYQYVNDYIPGIDDLDYYGDWQDVSNYGHCWRPRVDNGWAPYQSGYWTTDYPYGLTWVSNEPWGYAPYHYGRWASVGDQWYWVPDGARTRSVYSPALVAFIPWQNDSIGWVPLGPGDPYAPRYYDSNWTPRYLDRTGRAQDRVINLSVPGAATFVNARDFNRVIDRRSIERVDSQQFAHVRPVLDPFAVRNFRDVALRTRETGRRFDVSPQVAQRMDRSVFTSTTPVAPFRKDLAQRFHVQQVSEKVKGERLQLRDNRQSARNSGAAQPAPNQPNPNQGNMAAEQARERQMADLSREAARGNRAARQQVQQLQSQQRQERQQQRDQMAAQQRAGRMASQQAQGERVSNDMQKRPQPQPGGQQAARANRGRPYMRAMPQPQPNGPPAAQRQQQQQRTPRPVQRQQQPQAQPRDRQRYLGPPVKERANRAQPPRQQAAPQPRPMREQRQPQPQRQAQPQAQRQPAQIRQQQQPRPQAQPRPQQQQQQQQQQKNERHPPAQPAAAPAAAQQKNKKGPGRP
jgi:hypothetical protein